MSAEMPSATRIASSPQRSIAIKLGGSRFSGLSGAFIQV